MAERKVGSESMELLGVNIQALDVVIGLLGTLIVLTYAWSLKYHFDMPITPPGVRVISALVTSGSLLLLFLGGAIPQPALAHWAGLILMAASYWLFWATIRESRNARLLAAFDSDMPRNLLKTGPYAFVRHPFYLSYMMLWLGWWIAVWNVWGAVPFIAMGTTYWKAAGEEEQKFASTAMAEEYRDYARRTGRFLPRFTKRAH